MPLYHVYEIVKVQLLIHFNIVLPKLDSNPDN